MTFILRRNFLTELTNDITRSENVSYVLPYGLPYILESF